MRARFGRPGMDFYELRHFCATHLLELGVSHADVAVQLGHTDGGALVMSTYGHPSEDAARERLKRAYSGSVVAAEGLAGVAGEAQGGLRVAIQRRSSRLSNPTPPCPAHDVGVSMVGDPNDLRLSEDACSALTGVLAQPIVGFSAQGGHVEPVSPVSSCAGGLIVHSTASILVFATSVEVSPRDEVFPIAAFPWKPESVKPYDYVPPMARIDPRATSDLDLATPLGRTVEASVLSIDETDRGEFEDVKGIDTGIILKVGRWRLLIESMEHTDEAFTPMDLVLTTDSDTIDQHLERGAVRSIGGASSE